jgi:hypothetical protein
LVKPWVSWFASPVIWPNSDVLSNATVWRPRTRIEPVSATCRWRHRRHDLSVALSVRFVAQEFHEALFALSSMIDGLSAYGIFTFCGVVPKEQHGTRTCSPFKTISMAFDVHSPPTRLYREAPSTHCVKWSVISAVQQRSGILHKAS